MRMQRAITLMIIFLFAAMPTYGSADYVDALTKEASDLMRKYALADNQEQKQALEEIAALAKKNKSNENVIRIYTQILASSGHYKKAISVLEPFTRERPESALLLQECMLKERVRQHDAQCYKNALSAAEKKGVNNLDYLMILYFSGDKRFDQAKEKYLCHNGSDAIISIFDKSRDEVLKQLYPK
ncbi:hypothetical protein [Mixta hanseatica]|uniref:Tetratricopeptide repeat protein n=1 Tax=Mixta hanseatica TaxID=2872648 RepID=A0ABY4RD16_9GAMM|nr:hypothetical protein [Mixta hanseatica]UQY44902.1 hypothetical protein K6958_04210 [Mixta hanseatica]